MATSNRAASSNYLSSRNKDRYTTAPLSRIARRDHRLDRSTSHVMAFADELELDPEVALAALHVRRRWSWSERISRALWAYTRPVHFPKFSK